MRKIVALMAACILAASLAACDGTNKKINAPVESSEVSSSNYQDMVSQFKGAGFTNVSTKEIDDLILGWLTEDGQVEEVSIGGKTSFSTSDTFAVDAPVVVSYHTFPKKDKETTGSTPTPNQPSTSPAPQSPEPSQEPEPSPSPTASNENITVENNEEFRNLTQNPRSDGDTAEQFVAKYKGRIIEFDGNIALMGPHNTYKTRFDFLVYAGDYSTTVAYGPSFIFEDCNYYDLHLTGDNQPSSVSAGQNLHIIAKIIDFNSTQQLLHLEPIATSTR